MVDPISSVQLANPPFFLFLSLELWFCSKDNGPTPGNESSYLYDNYRTCDLFARYAHVTQFFWSMKLRLVTLEIKRNTGRMCFLFWHFLAFCLCVKLCARIWLLEPWPPSWDNERRALRIQTGDANLVPVTEEQPSLTQSLTNILASVNNCPHGLSLSWLGMECSLQKPPFPFVYSSISQCVADFIQVSSVQSLSRVLLFATPWITACQASLSITNSRSSLRLKSIESVMPSSHLILWRPLLLLPSIPPSMSLFKWVSSSHEVAKVLEFQLQHHSLQRNPRADLLQNGLVGSPCSPRDSQESSPAAQFKSINYLALSLLHSPTLTSIHDHRKNHSLD